jgi:hypothetical protein
MSDFCGGGSSGWAPIPASSGNRAVPPQPASANAMSAAEPEANNRDEVCM